MKVAFWLEIIKTIFCIKVLCIWKEWFVNLEGKMCHNFWTKFGLLTHCVYVGDIYICHSWPSKIKRLERHHAALQEHYLYSSGHLLTSYLKRWNFFSQSIEVGIQLEKKSELLKCFSLFFFQTKKGQKTERCDYTTYRKQMQNIFWNANFSNLDFWHEKPPKNHFLGWLTFYRLGWVEFYRYQKGVR